MARKRENATKRSFILSNDLMDHIERIAISEHRSMTAQIEVFLWEMVRKFEKLEKGKIEKEQAEG